jgi:hypothetical protein
VGFLFSESVIDPTIIQPYRETDYRVYGDTPFTLTIDTVSPALLALQASSQTTSNAFITACNPFSESNVEVDNAALQKALSGDLQQRGLTFIDGIGQHPSNEWPGEPSFLVLGVSIDTAKAIGIHYRQNAIVWSGSDGSPELLFLR